MRFLQFILSHSLFIACCAAGLCYQTNVLLHIPHNVNIYSFIFCSTLCSYNFYWLLSKFYFSDRSLSTAFFRKNSSFIIVFFIAAAGTILFFWEIKEFFTYIAGGVLLTLLYSLPLWPFAFAKKLQRAGFFKTTLLSLTWAYVTTTLPAASMPHLPLMPFAALFSARFFFMLLLCIIFDMRDISVDKMHGLHSLATDFSRKNLSIIIAFVISLYILSGLFVRYHFHDNAQLVAFSVTGIIVWLVYKLSLKPQGYVFYYFLVDGLMLVAAVLTCLANNL